MLEDLVFEYIARKNNKLDTSIQSFENDKNVGINVIIKNEVFGVQLILKK